MTSVDEGLRPLPDGWALEDGRLVKVFRFQNFPEALGFMVEVGLHCERSDHHPDWRNVYDRVTVALWTHDKGAVTAKDLALAQVMEEVAGRRRG